MAPATSSDQRLARLAQLVAQLGLEDRRGQHLAPHDRRVADVVAVVELGEQAALDLLAAAAPRSRGPAVVAARSLACSSVARTSPLRLSK